MTKRGSNNKKSISMPFGNAGIRKQAKTSVSKDKVKESLRKYCKEQKTIKKEEHYLYVMQSIDLRGFIKVGISKNVGLRSAKPQFSLNSIGGGYLGEDEIQSIWKPRVRNNFRFSNRQLAKTFESLIHYQLKVYSVEGEYFYVGKTGMAMLDKLLEDMVEFSKTSLNETVLTGDDLLDELEDF